MTKPDTDTSMPVRPLTRRTLLAGTAGLGAASLLATLPAGKALAHHGWGSFDTRYAYFAAGSLSQVRWGNPHSTAHLKVEQTALPGNWAQRQLPPGAIERDGRATLASTRPYRGRHTDLELVLADPEWMSRWGLNRPLAAGERIEVVGFMAADGDPEFRPVMFWLADGQGVWQQLTSFPRRPEPALAQ